MRSERSRQPILSNAAWQLRKRAERGRVSRGENLPDGASGGNTRREMRDGENRPLF